MIEADSCGACRAGGGVEGSADSSSLAAFFTNLFDTSAYPPRWECGVWTPLEGWLHIGSDVGIFLAYFAIPLALVYFIRKRSDTPFHAVFLLFAAFILACGTVHLLEAIIFYVPVYRLAGLLKLATAVISWSTFLVLWRLIPKALELPQLATDNEMLRRADSAKSEFVAHMSHEIRTPMTAILGYAELLDDNHRGAGGERRRAVDAIKRNGEHLLEVINDILDLAKIEAGKLSLETRRCCPLSLLQDVLALVRVRATEKGLNLLTEIDGPLPATIRTDPRRVCQILINVIGNAIKFTERGTVRVTVRVGYQADGEGRLEFRIADSGVGIPPERLAELFSPFTQADSSTTRRYGGTGLGLTISRELAQALGGDISARSEVGVGSEFTVRLATGPLADVPFLEHDAASIESSTPPEKEMQARRFPVPYRILVADDGQDNRRLLTFLLERAGGQVTAACDGHAAAEALRRGESDGSPFDLVLMDMQMPVVDGYAATRRLRESGYEKPIIALTAYAMAGDRQKCLDAGCDDYLAKPIDREQLISTVVRHAESWRSRETPSCS